MEPIARGQRPITPPTPFPLRRFRLTIAVISVPMTLAGHGKNRYSYKNGAGWWVKPVRRERRDGPNREWLV